MSGIVEGECTLYNLTAEGKLVPLITKRNSLMVTWGFAAAKSLGMGNPAYAISQVYIEYANVAAPLDVVSTPSFTVYEGRTYYTTLTPPRDYLRVPLHGEPTLDIATGYESYFTAGVDGNQLLFLSQTAGSAGENGLPFSNALNSKVYGVALVSSPDIDDASQDIIVSRAYYSAAEQQLKQVSGQIVVSWKLKFLPSA